MTNVPDLRTRRNALLSALTLDLVALRQLADDFEAAGWIYNAGDIRRRIKHYEEERDAEPVLQNDYTDC